MRRLFGVLLVIGALVGCASAARDARLAVIERGGSYELTVPLSRVMMIIPRGALVPAAVAHDSPRYFHLHDKATALIVSGWFEPAERYPGLQVLWSNDTLAWRRQGLPEPRNVRLSRIGSWEVVAYDMLVPSATNTHLRAQRVQAGTWIDLHLSITSTRSTSQNQSTLEKTLRAIEVKEKTRASPKERV